MSSSSAQRLVIAEAQRRNWAVREIGSSKELAIITNTSGRALLFKGGRPPHTSANGQVVALHKRLSLEFTESLNIAVPPFALYAGLAQARRFLAKHEMIVVKPDDAEKGSGVTVGITTEAELQRAITEAQAVSKDILLQKHQNGRHYRLFVAWGKVVAAAQRTEPRVIGDGHLTVRELIERENQNPLREGDNPVLLRIAMERVAVHIGTMIDAIPAKGEQIKVLPLANLSSGGESIDVTDQVHESYKDAAGRICESLGLFTCGIDIIAKDISLGYGEVLPLIEINSKPGYRLHHFPTQGGAARNVAAMVLDAAFNE